MAHCAASGQACWMAATAGTSTETPKRTVGRVPGARFPGIFESMLHLLMPMLFFLALPFWEARPPEKWSDAEIAAIRHDSPWAQPSGLPPQQVVIYLATAAPVEQAETELRLRLKKNPH